MTEPRTDRDAAHAPADKSAEPVRYPRNHVLGVVDSPEQLGAAMTALRDAGFLESEIDVVHGQAAADALDASTGHSGLTDFAMRLAERIGVSNDEMDVKRRYEHALRDGGTIVFVLTPTDERKELAARVLHESGGHLINYMGRFSWEAMHR